MVLILCVNTGESTMEYLSNDYREIVPIIFSNSSHGNELWPSRNFLISKSRWRESQDSGQSINKTCTPETLCLKWSRTFKNYIELYREKTSAYPTRDNHTAMVKNKSSLFWNPQMPRVSWVSHGLMPLSIRSTRQQRRLPPPYRVSQPSSSWLHVDQGWTLFQHGLVSVVVWRSMVGDRHWGAYQRLHINNSGSYPVEWSCWLVVMKNHPYEKPYKKP